MGSTVQEGYAVFFRGSEDQAAALEVVPTAFSVPLGEQLELTIRLSTVGPGTSKATFPDDSIVWRTVEPPDVEVTVEAETIKLTEYNQDPSENGDVYIFQLCVEYEGKRYCVPDPVVFNEGQGGATPGSTFVPTSLRS